jgi:hypothetical protein
MKIIAGVFVICVLVAFFDHPSGTSNTNINTSPAEPTQINAAPTLPPLESKFIDIVSAAQSQSTQTENDMQKGGVKAARDSQLCATIKTLDIDGWIGTISDINSNSDGKGVLSVEIAPNVDLKTWNNSFSDIGDQTLIEPNSTVFQIASVMHKGDLVEIGGKFYSGTDSDCLKEGSLSLNGKLQHPEFIFKFSSIAAYDPSKRSTTKNSDVPRPDVPSQSAPESKFIDDAKFPAARQSDEHVLTSANVPSMESGNYSKLCKDEWTKRGELDQRMFDYCVRSQQNGYAELVTLANKYDGQNWIRPAIDVAIKEGSKAGAREDEIVAYSLKKITEGWADLEYAKTESNFNKSKYDSCITQWYPQFDVAAYCYKHD